MAEKKDRPKRTFILGAGASKHAGGKLVHEILALPVQCPQDAAAVSIEKARDLLARNGMFSGNMNFEELLTQIDLRRRAVAEDSLEAQELDRARSLLVDAVMELCSSNRVNPKEATEGFCQCLVDGDAIVTFNYDILMERTLWKLGKWSLQKGYGLDLGDECQPLGNEPTSILKEPENGLVRVFKPHGSENFRVQRLGEYGETVGDNILMEIRGGDFEGVEPFDLETTMVTIHPLSHTIPRTALAPSFIKSYATVIPWMRDMWHRSYERIRCSTHMWLVGYSIPEADTDAQLLLSAADPTRKPVFHIVDPSGDEVAKRLRQLVPRPEKTVRVHRKKLEDCDWAALLSGKQ